MTYHLHRWSVQYSGADAYTAPELIKPTLVGFRDAETSAIRTSSVVSVDGREVTTYSGSVYILEDIDPNYRDWLAEIGVEYDPENPIKLRK